MLEVNYIAVAAAVVAAFVASSIWYMFLGNAMVRLQGKKPDPNDPSQQMPPWKIGVELLRTVVVAVALAHVLARLGVNEWIEGVGYALLLWVTFPVVLLGGSVIHDSVPWRLAAIHSGDWFLKLMVVSIIVGVWH